MASIAFIFALLAGALITCQTGSNSQLKKSLTQPLPALIVNYLLGITAVGLYTWIRRVPIPTLEQAGSAPWWGWVGGVVRSRIRSNRDTSCKPDGCRNLNGPCSYRTTRLRSDFGPLRLAWIRCSSRKSLAPCRLRSDGSWFSSHREVLIPKSRVEGQLGWPKSACCKQVCSRGL